MAEVSRRVGRGGGKLLSLSKRSNQRLYWIDGKLSVGAVVKGALLNVIKCAFNSAKLDDNKPPGGDCPEWQLSQPDGVTHLGESRNCKHVKLNIIVDEINTSLSKPENNVDSLNGGFPHASGLDLSVEVNDRKFTHSIQNVTDCRVEAVDCKNYWFDTRDLSMTESQCPKIPDCRRMLSDICLQRPASKISCLKKNTCMISATHLTNHQQQRWFFTRLNRSEMQWNCFTKAGCSGALSLARAYSWHGQSSTAPPLYRSRTAYYDILNVSPSATQTQIKTAYYKQSFIYHPDRNSGSAEATQRFSEISEAYTVLGSIALRKKYDRGILSQADVQGAGKPSAREARSSAPVEQLQKKPRYPHSTGDKKIFDFDAFYRAHYGEQLQREKQRRLRREKLREEQQKGKEKQKFDKMTELSVVIMMVLVFFIFAGM